MRNTCINQIVDIVIGEFPIVIAPLTVVFVE